MTGPRGSGASGNAISEPLSHEYTVNSAAFSPDGKRVVTASFDQTTIWDAATSKAIGEPLRGHEDKVNSVRSARTAPASSPRLGTTPRIWDAATGKPIGEPLKGHLSTVSSAVFSADGTRIVTASVLSAGFSPDGKRIVTASADKTTRVWDAATGKPIGEPLAGHDGNVNSAAFNPDGQRIVTASDDGTAQIWDVARAASRSASRSRVIRMQ
jgi:WD40 repeat protein